MIHLCMGTSRKRETCRATALSIGLTTIPPFVANGDITDAGRHALSTTNSRLWLCSRSSTVSARSPASTTRAGSFRLRGRTSHDDNVALAKALLDQHRIFTVHRDGPASGACVRVTPALATRINEMDQLATAIRSIVKG